MKPGVEREEVEDSRGDASITDLGERPIVAMPALELERGAVLAGRYQIEAVIGKGGSGVVFRAFDRIAQTPVALKILNPELAAEPHWAERFSRELRLARQIQHPNVCRVYDIGEADGHRFLSMELATGGTLRGVRLEDKSLRPFAERVADARALVEGLAAIHAAGIIHRDVKPENLLRMEDGRVVVSDFGLATNPDQVPSVTVMVGTPSYMAPEMVMGDPASKSSDVWALGVTMHEILFGRRPEWDLAAGERTFRDPVGSNGTPLERSLARLCGRCASEFTNNRPANAGEVAALFLGAETPRQAARITRRSRQRLGWGALAMASVLGLLTLRTKLWTTASATSTHEGNSLGTIEPTGQPVDWTSSSRILVELPGRVHCFATLPDQKTVRVVWGSPRKAEDVVVGSGQRSISPLDRQTFEQGCPETSPRGNGILFSMTNTAGEMQIMHSVAPDGSDARMVTRGSEPRWLPNGQEFLYSLDDKHAAVFSLPTMTFSLVPPNSSSATAALAGLTVSPLGDALGVMYIDERADYILTVHAIPNLTAVGHFRLPSATRQIEFDVAGVGMGFSVEDTPATSRWAELDWRSGRARNLARIPDSDVRAVRAVGDSTTVFVSRRISSDAWLPDATVAGRRITSDGETYSGAISPAGDVLLGKRTADGSLMILANRADGTPAGKSAGGRDVYPAFAPDGKTWVYVSYEKKALVLCTFGADDCRTIHSNAAIPSWPVFSPDGLSIGYVSQLGVPRAYVVSIETGRTHDLGPARKECAPVWVGFRSLWVYQGTETDRVWAEFDPIAATVTGKQSEAPMVGNGAEECSNTGPMAMSTLRGASRRLVIRQLESSAIWARSPARPSQVR